MDVALSDWWLPVGVALLAALTGGAWRLYQRCPHCGGLVRRAKVGWRRCGHCGRQYRRGLKLR